MGRVQPISRYAKSRSRRIDRLSLCVTVDEGPAVIHIGDRRTAGFSGRRRWVSERD